MTARLRSIGKSICSPGGRRGRPEPTTSPTHPGGREGDTPEKRSLLTTLLAIAKITNRYEPPLLLPQRLLTLAMRHREKRRKKSRTHELSPRRAWIAGGPDAGMLKRHFFSRARNLREREVKTCS